MSLLKEFKEFAMRGSVVDLAVGVIIGAAFGKIISSLVADVLMPPIGLLVGGIDFSSLKVNLGSAQNATEQAAIKYGTFINNVIDFLIVAIVIFIAIKGINMLKRSEKAAPPVVKDCPECMMQIPVKAKRCGHCTSVLT